MYTILQQLPIPFLIFLNLFFLGLTIFTMTYVVDHFDGPKQLSAKSIKERCSIVNALLCILLGLAFFLFLLIQKIFGIPIQQNVAWSVVSVLLLSVVIYVVVYIRYQRKRV